MANFDSGPQYVFDNLIDNEPMTGEMIERLSESCKHRYIVPFDQRLSNIKSLILWNPHNRPGAKEESENLVHTLEKIGGAIDVVEWYKQEYLQGVIRGKLREIQTHKDCSLFIVTIMSHGKMGMIYDEDDVGLPIDNVIEQLHNGMPGHIPLVVIIQACQHIAASPSSNHMDMAQRGRPVEKEFFNIPREHMLLLVSSVAHGLSERGLLVEHLSGQLERADGKTELRSLINKAISTMASDFPKQIVDLRHSLRKDLILPPVAEVENQEQREKVFRNILQASLVAGAFSARLSSNDDDDEGFLHKRRGVQETKSVSKKESLCSCEETEYSVSCQKHHDIAKSECIESGDKTSCIEAKATLAYMNAACKDTTSKTTQNDPENHAAAEQVLKDLQEISETKPSIFKDLGDLLIGREFAEKANAGSSFGKKSKTTRDEQPRRYPWEKRYDHDDQCPAPEEMIQRLQKKVGGVSNARKMSPDSSSGSTSLSQLGAASTQPAVQRNSAASLKSNSLLAFPNQMMKAAWTKVKPVAIPFLAIGAWCNDKLVSLSVLQTQDSYQPPNGSNDNGVISGKEILYINRTKTENSTTQSEGSGGVAEPQRISLPLIIPTSPNASSGLTVRIGQIGGRLFHQYQHTVQIGDAMVTRASLPFIW